MHHAGRLLLHCCHPGDNLFDAFLGVAPACEMVAERCCHDLSAHVLTLLWVGTSYDLGIGGCRTQPSCLIHLILSPCDIGYVTYMLFEGFAGSYNRR